MTSLEDIVRDLKKQVKRITSQPTNAENERKNRDHTPEPPSPPSNKSSRSPSPVAILTESASDSDLVRYSILFLLASSALITVHNADNL